MRWIQLVPKACVAGACLALWGALRVHAAPAEIQFSAPTVSLPARYVLETDPQRAALGVRVVTQVTRAQFCPSGNLLLPCPPQDTPVRITAWLTSSSGLRPLATAVTNLSYAVAGNANFEIDEMVWLDPETYLSDTIGYTVRVIIEHVDDLSAGTFQEDHDVATGPHTIAHFSGEIQFGAIPATLTSLANQPSSAGASLWNLVIASGQTANGHPFAHSLQVPPPVTAARDANGRLTVQAGSVGVASPPAFEWAGWEGERGVTRLSTNGLVAASMTLTLPAGVGWRAPTERLLRSRIELADDIPLDADLNPVGNGGGSFASAIQWFSELYPVEFSGAAWRWANGVLSVVTPATRFIRADWYQDWQAQEGDIQESNEGYWFLLRPAAASNLEIRPGMEGGISVELQFRNGEFFSHFPRGAARVTSGGNLRIENNRAVPEVSGFEDADAYILYGKGCRDPGALDAIPDPLQGVLLTGVDLQFTPNAGLWGAGPLTPTSADPDVERHLEIGRSGSVPTHRTEAFEQASFYMPGPWIPTEDGFDSEEGPNGVIDEPGEPPRAFNPARALLTGVVPGAGFAWEHPGFAAYSAGLGDYAGMNYRASEGMEAESTVAGISSDPYPLTLRSKYYARQSGVSGIHESAAGPDHLPAYGYDIQLTRFGLSFLSNEPHDSRINGTVRLPHPSALTQDFERLLMSCCGNLTDGQIAPGDDQKQLAYWSGTDITTHSLRFTHDPEDPCDTGNGVLELGVTANVAHLDVEPPGFLYPRPDGTLVATDDLERESHLTLPAVATFAGYPFTAVRRAYFNDFAEFTDGPGWINLAGLAGVSFFRDLTAHAHVLGSMADPAPPVFIKAGWSAGGDTYFNTAGFDPGHRGYPPGVSVGHYETGPTHLPRAQQVWFDGAAFDYEVQFDWLTRSFVSPAPVGVDLIIVDLDSRVERLNAELADLRFSAFLDLGLLSAGDLLAEEGASWLTGRLEDATVNQIREGLNRLAAMLDARMTDLLDNVVLPAVEDTVVVPLVQAVQQAPVITNINAQLTLHLNEPLRESLQGIADAVSDATHLVGRASETLDRAVSALETVRNTLAQLQQVEALVLAGLEYAGFSTNVPMDVLLEDLESELDGETVGRLVEIREAIQELEQSLGTLIGALQQGQAFFAHLQDTVLAPIAEYTQLAADIELRLGVWLRGAFAADPAAFSTGELRARVRQEIRDAFAESPIAGNLQAVIRSWIYNADAAVRQALDVAFQAINDQITEAATVVLEELERAVMPVKTYSSILNSVNVNGRAHIRGDRLSLLRLDSGAVIDLPTPLPGVTVPVEFTGYFEFRELTSDGPVGCLGGDPARIQEITLSSSAGPASMFAAGNVLTVASKFTRNEEGELLQLAGSLEMESQGPELQVIGLRDFSATLSIGPGANEYYLSAFCRGYWNFPGSGALPIPRELAGGAFFGRTCSLDAFSWDPEAETVIGGLVGPGDPFTGVYLFGEATIPFADVGCIVNGSLSAGARIWLTGHSTHGMSVGGRLDGGVSGDFLCLARLRGSAFLQGSKAPDEPFEFVGGAEVSAELGICPFCLELGGDVSATFNREDGWSLEH